MTPNEPSNAQDRHPRQPPTRAALLTPPGRGGIAVVGLAGPRAETMLMDLFSPERGNGPPGAGRLRLGRLADRRGAIDQALVGRTGPGRFELNVHGGPAAARAVLDALASLGAEVPPNAPAVDASLVRPHPRWANPAIAAELLDALPLARTRHVAAILAGQWSDGLSRLAWQTRQALREPRPPTAAEGANLAEALTRAARRLPAMRRLLNPPEVVLLGPPNAGKSALANALVGREVSIVHASAGTTRDWVRELAEMAGLPTWLTDTAGIWAESSGRASPDAGGSSAPPAGLSDIDRQAVDRGRARAKAADLVLLCSAGQAAARPAWLAGADAIRIATRADADGAWSGADVAVSAVTGAGLDDLRGKILDALGLADLAAEACEPASPAAFTDRQARRLIRAAALRRAPAGAEGELTALLAGP